MGSHTGKLYVAYCPKCSALLKEISPVPLYRCCGCNSFLLVKNWKLENSSDLENVSSTKHVSMKKLKDSETTSDYGSMSTCGKTKLEYSDSAIDLKIGTGTNEVNCDDKHKEKLEESVIHSCQDKSEYVCDNSETSLIDTPSVGDDTSLIDISTPEGERGGAASSSIKPSFHDVSIGREVLVICQGGKDKEQNIIAPFDKDQTDDECVDEGSSVFSGIMTLKRKTFHPIEVTVAGTSYEDQRVTNSNVGEEVISLGKDDNFSTIDTLENVPDLCKTLVESKGNTVLNSDTPVGTLDANIFDMSSEENAVESWQTGTDDCNSLDSISEVGVEKKSPIASDGCACMTHGTASSLVSVAYCTNFSNSFNDKLLAINIEQEDSEMDCHKKELMKQEKPEAESKELEKDVKNSTSVERIEEIISSSKYTFVSPNRTEKDTKNRTDNYYAHASKGSVTSVSNDGVCNNTSKLKPVSMRRFRSRRINDSISILPKLADEESDKKKAPESAGRPPSASKLSTLSSTESMFSSNSHKSSANDTISISHSEDENCIASANTYSPGKAIVDVENADLQCIVEECCNQPSEQTIFENKNVELECIVEEHLASPSSLQSSDFTLSSEGIISPRSHKSPSRVILLNSCPKDEISCTSDNVSSEAPPKKSVVLPGDVHMPSETGVEQHFTSLASLELCSTTEYMLSPDYEESSARSPTISSYPEVRASTLVCAVTSGQSVSENNDVDVLSEVADLELHCTSLLSMAEYISESDSNNIPSPSSNNSSIRGLIPVLHLEDELPSVSINDCEASLVNPFYTPHHDNEMPNVPKVTDYPIKNVSENSDLGVVAEVHQEQHLVSSSLGSRRLDVGGLLSLNSHESSATNGILISHPKDNLVSAENGVEMGDSSTPIPKPQDSVIHDSAATQQSGHAHAPKKSKRVDPNHVELLKKLDELKNEIVKSVGQQKNRNKHKQSNATDLTEKILLSKLGSREEFKKLNCPRQPLKASRSEESLSPKRVPVSEKINDQLKDQAEQYRDVGQPSPASSSTSSSSNSTVLDSVSTASVSKDNRLHAWKHRYHNHGMRKVVHKRRELSGIDKNEYEKQHCRALVGGAPFIVCQKCLALVQMPDDLHFTDRKRKLQCGGCSEFFEISLKDKTHIVLQLHAQRQPSKQD